MSISFHMEKRDLLKKILSGSFLIFGTTVGAGMLGIPAMTAGAGFWPAALVTLVVWLFMLATGLLLLEVVLRMPSGANLISLAGRFLGNKGKWIVGFLFLFLYGSLLVAYFAGGAPLLDQFFSFLGFSFPLWVNSLFFAALFGGVIFLGSHWISRVNFVLSMTMLLAYIVLLILGSGGVKNTNLSSMQFSLTFGAIPVLFSAFGFHNVVPSLVQYLEKDRRALRFSLCLGTFLAFVFYLVWQWLVLGTVSPAALESVKMQGLPVTYALQTASSGKSIYALGQVFAFLALTTSFLGVGFSFVDFIQDGIRESKMQISRAFCSSLTVFPPLIAVLLIPALFEKALGVAGGFGESLLNGVLPVLLFLKMRQLLDKETLQRKEKGWALFLIVFSLLVVLIECKALIS